MNESVNGNNENEEKLIINIGEAYRPVVENYERAKESMFKPIYEKGRNLVKEICEAYGDNNSTNEYKINSENYNNIIAFIGERGSGKTSSMLTFSNLLNDEEFLKKGLSMEDNNKDNLGYIKFIQNDVIDPSQFDKNVNILEIILAGMFKNFKNKADKIDSTDRQSIIECFDKVYRNLKTLKKESNSIYDGEVLEALLEMSASMEIKENLSKLISVYLEKVETTSDKNSILVIKIDDIDLNTEHAHAMVEQLRKYLMLPRVLILMALKMDQLHDVVNQTHYISLEALSNMKNKDNRESCISISDKVIDMTEKYLSKLFPIDHRLLMPEPAIFSSSKKFEIRTNLNEKGIEYTSLDYGIREIIYRKTGLHFIKPDKNENPIVPSNLRELVNFVHYLQKFEDVKVTSKEKVIRCINSIIGNVNSKKELDDKIKEILQSNKKTLEDFSWLLDCPLTEDNEDWKVLCEEKKNYNRSKSNKDDLKIFNIEDEIFLNLKNELNLINDYENDNIYLARKQLLKFKNYFLSYWCQNKISKDGQSLIKRFLELDNKRKNKFIVLELEKIFKIAELLKKHIGNTDNSNNRTLRNLEKYLENYLENYTQVSTIVNYEANISLGDVLYTLSILEKLNMSKEVLNLIFAIKTIYYLELEILNLTMESDVKKELLGDRDYLIGGEYFSSFQKQIIADELISRKSRSLRECKLKKIIQEKEFLENDKKLPTMIFINLMFNRGGNINENYRIKDEIYYDLYEKLNGRQDNYVLSINSPLFNSFRLNEFIQSKIYNENSKGYIDEVISINDIEKHISNISLLEYLFIESLGDKKINFTNIEDVTACWHEFYESLNSRMRFFDGISYFSIFNMNFMKVFRKSDIKNINISENELDKLIDRMEADKTSRKSLQNYWIDHYSETKKDISALEEIRLDTLNNYITEMNFLKFNKTNTSFKLKHDLIDILKSLSSNKSEEMDTLLKRKEEEWLERNPDEKKSYAKKYFEEGNDYAYKKNYNKSIELYTKAVELDFKNPIYWSTLGWAYYRDGKGDLDKAIQAYTEAVNLDSNNSVYWNILGNAYYRDGKGDLDKAIQAYTKAVNLDSSNSEYWYSLGNAYYRGGKGDLDKAIETFNKACALDPNISKYYDALGNAHYLRNGKGDFDTAIEKFNEACKLDPTISSYWNNLGAVYYRNGKSDADKAIDSVNRALKLNDQNPSYWNNLGMAYYNRKNEDDYDKAIKAHEKAIELNFQNPNYWNNLGNDYYYRKNDGDLQKAIECYETALKQKNITANLIKDINKKLSKCQEELSSIESQTEEPTETNLEDLESKDNE